MKKTSLSALALSALFAASCIAAPAVTDKPAAAPANAAAPAAKAAKPAAKAVKVAPAKAAAAVAVPLKSDAPKLVVKGDSTMHKWDATAQSVTVTGELSKDGDLLAAIKANGLSKLTLLAGVDSLHSNEGKSMDKNMHKAMESDSFGSITFILASYEVTGDQVSAKGSLSIHGVAKDVVLTGTLSAKDGGAVNVKGSYDLLMSDYGVKPPVMMMGTIKVRDALTIDYDFDLTK